MGPLLENYNPTKQYDELYEGMNQPREGAETLAQTLETISSSELHDHHKAAALALRNMGITFNVYNHESGVERIWPLDIIPRIITRSEWAQIEKGLKQRIHALNLFLFDIYNDQKIIKDKVLPRELVESASSFRRPCLGLNPTNNIFCHISGIDLVRHDDGQIYVLEDNLRIPSGVSYVLENRAVMKRTFPQLFEGLSVRPVEDYPEMLLNTLIEAAPTTNQEPRAVVLTPGPYNSAYFEHCYLAQQMGIELVQPSDLAVVDDSVQMRTTKGYRKIDVIYSRIDDDFLDPTVFRKDSLLGIPGIMDAYYRKKVTLCNAPGCGVADDKAIYAYVPQIINYYLGESAIIPNVPTFLCSKEKDRRHVLENLENLVVKPTNGSGGYGLMFGPKSTQAEREACTTLILENPRNYIAQPMLNLSTVPTLVQDGVDVRHVDLRPFILYGQEIKVLPGGLTRVALPKGSMVVNSSQGGGSKDTWILQDPPSEITNLKTADTTLIDRWQSQKSRPSNLAEIEAYTNHIHTIGPGDKGHKRRQEHVESGG